ncbi:MAG: DNA/RNA helicase domain-containing protein [Thermoleophilia bacterium]
MSNESTQSGWSSDFPTFRDSEPYKIRKDLHSFVGDASPAQIRAWDESIPLLQGEVNEVLNNTASARSYESIMEYELPMESRRTDAIFLTSGGVVVIELKGKASPSRADIDQAAAYGRDMRCYHRECHSQPVHTILVPTRAEGYLFQESGVHVLGPDVIDIFVDDIRKEYDHAPTDRDAFLSADAYCPLPTIVEAARELMQSGTIRTIHRARAATEPALEEISRIIHEAAATKTRRLILLTGVPGAGKTLVGLQTVHAHFLDDLAVKRADGNNGSPAVYLSGNGPLVQVLQYELKSAGGGGRTFVRGVKDYVKRYSSKADLVPPEHVLVFDEAQRAFDADQVRDKHSSTPGFEGGKSEPEHFIEFAERIPEWCVVVGLIGGGQEIHIGEEAGIVQWLHAIEGSHNSSAWTIHMPPSAKTVFAGSSISQTSNNALNLDTEIRFHLASDLHDFVADLLDNHDINKNRKRAEQLESDNYHLRITRNIDTAKSYLRERYGEDPDARFGLIASSKDKELNKFGVNNDYLATMRVKYGPWYGDSENDEGHHSCRHLDTCITEFGAQGLELDSVLLAWGTDLIREDGVWSNERARGYRNASRIKDPFQLRLNAYRVLLTRGRDASVVFLPQLEIMNETYNYLVESGFLPLD